MRSLLLQRICSSSTAGLATTRAIANRLGVEEGGDEPQVELLAEGDDDRLLDLGLLDGPSPEETKALRQLLGSLREAVEASPTGLDADPKLQVLRHYLTKVPCEGGRLGWLNLGCIIFSQYYDTALWVADALAAEFPKETLGLYASSSRSKIYIDGKSASVHRDDLKRMVKEGTLRLLVATDAACEGLNLQTLGTEVNIDMPWNPSKLEQRIGRIKREGQRRDSVDMLNLVYEGSRDQDVYAVISARMQDRFDVLGQLPDVIKDDWIESRSKLEQEFAKQVSAKRQMSAFDVRWGSTATGLGSDEAELKWQAGWESCSKVLARSDIEHILLKKW